MGLVSAIIQYGFSEDEKALCQACVAPSDKQGLFGCNTEELCIRPHHQYSPCNKGSGQKVPTPYQGAFGVCVPAFPCVSVSLRAHVSLPLCASESQHEHKYFVASHVARGHSYLVQLQ